MARETKDTDTEEELIEALKDLDISSTCGGLSKSQAKRLRQRNATARARWNR